MSNNIRTLKYNTHPVLGSLELDFCKADKPCNTIVFAGENGSGKTTILSTLSEFLNVGSIAPFSHIQCNIDNKIFNLNPYESNSENGFHTREEIGSGKKYVIQRDKNFEVNKIQDDKSDIRHYGCVYSKSRSGFTTKPVTHVTTQELDQQSYERDSADDFTPLKQLLIDIIQQDNNEWASISGDGNAHNKVKEFDPNSRLSRFKKAFENFFDSKISLEKSDIIGGKSHQIFFKKNGKSIPLDDLSTGEKQIVFRGAMLLKNLSKLKGGFVFIDEPELSMHPKWQQKVLKYYRDLFTVDGEQIVQMFIATHSEYVLKSALDDKDNILLISLCDENGTIVPKKITLPVTLSTLKSSEINYIVFGIPTEEYHDDLYEHVQKLSGKIRIKDVDEFISLHNKFKLDKHSIHYRHNKVLYKTLPTYIRNCIHHPDNRQFTPEQLQSSIKLLIDICNSEKES